jgi:myo-inositol 2-dehydrogenase/D-chiro-inositol 1-dehydrogenase
MKILKFALLGAGRIGKIHAANIALNSKCSIECIYDIDSNNAKEISDSFGGAVASSPQEAISNTNVDVVYICSSTPTHTEYILSAAKAGKAIFCEKPIDLDIDRVNKCKKELEKYNVPLHIGFNRRFDPSHLSANEKKNKGEIGALEQIIITSRDPSGPSAAYLKVSGGMFRDMTIHDFDFACFILQDDPIDEIFATGDRLFSAEAKEANDIDTAMIIMKSKSGVLCHINNSRHSSYGYDQRVELFGDKGMIISDNQTPTSVTKYNNENTNSKDPILNFFIERYSVAYKNQLDNFVNCIIDEKSPTVNFEDGRIALIIANAAYESLENKKSVKIDYN